MKCFSAEGVTHSPMLLHQTEREREKEGGRECVCGCFFKLAYTLVGIYVMFVLINSVYICQMISLQSQKKKNIYIIHSVLVYKHIHNTIL